MEAYMHEVAQRNDTVRFVKLYNEDADLDGVAVPAVLAYNGGDMIANLVGLRTKMPYDSELSVVSLETVFRQ